MRTRKYSILILFVLIVFLPLKKLQAQKDFPHDTSYYETFRNSIAARVFLSQKYIHMNFPEPAAGAQELEYKANAKLNLGVGISYHGVSLNAFYGFSFLNKKDEPKGKTKGLNLQLHVYPRKWAIDVLALFPKGYYLDPKGFASASPNSYYTRPDIQSTLLGISVYKVPNKQKFSYRAAIVQTEWQKKSAGSLLYGGQFYYGSMKGDSALVPSSIQGSYPQAGIHKINFFTVGPGIGYAYTLVIASHLFLTGSLVGNLDVSFTNEEGTSKNSKVSISPAEVFKAACGYNSRTWNVSVNWTGNGIWFKGDAASKNYFWPSGNYKFVISRKFARKH